MSFLKARTLDLLRRVVPAALLWTLFCVVAGWMHQVVVGTGNRDEIFLMGPVWLAGLVGIGLTAWRFARERRRMDRAYAALAENERSFRLFYEQAPAAYQALDAHGVLLEVNAAWCALFGYERAEVIGRPVADFILPEQHAILQSRFARFLETGEIRELEYHFRHRAGHTVVVAANGRVVRDADGKFTRTHCVLYDLTERRRAEADLRAAQTRLQALIGHLQVGVLVQDEKRRVIYANEAYCRLWQLAVRPGELLGGTRESASAATIRLLPQPAQFAARVDALLGGGVPALGEIVTLADGRSLERDYIPVREGMQSLGHLWVYRDITARHDQEEALRASERRYSALVNHVDGIVWEADARTFRFTFVSPQAERLLGYPPGDWLEQPSFWQDHIHPEDRASAVGFCVRATAQGLNHDFEYRMRTADGREIWIRDLVAVESHDGHPVTLRGIMLDVTERRRTQEALRESERLARATLDSLASPVAILDEAGRILAVNRAWRTFAEDAGVWPARVGQGANYLESCDRVAGSPDGAACAFANGIRRVTRGEQSIYEQEYRCDLPGRPRWFLGCVTRFSGEGPLRVVVVHENITATKQAEAALRRSEHDLLEAQAIAHLGSYHWDLVTGQLEWSDETYRIWGLEEPLSQEKILAHVHPEDSARVAELARLAVSEAEDFEAEYRIIRPDGQVRHVYDRARLHRGAKGEAVRMFGTALDVTERRQAEAAWRDSEERYEMLFRGMLEGFAVHEIVYDPSGHPVDFRFLQVNPAFERLCQLAAHEVVGRTVRQVMSGVEHVWIENYNRVATSGVASSFEEYNRVLGRHLQVNAFRPMPGRLACVFVDITARKAAEFDLRKLSRAVEQSPVSIIITDARGRIEYVNPRFTVVTGYSLEEVRGSNPRLLNSGQLAPVVYRDLWETITGGGEWRGELHNRKKNGEYFWEFASISPILDEGGRTTHFLAVKEDVTTRRVAEERLREQVALLDVTEDAVVVLDLERRVTFWNRGAETIYGWPAAAAVGRRHPELVDVDYPGESDAVFAQLHAAGYWRGERRHATKSGREIIVQLRATLVHDAVNRPKSLLLVATDITEAKQMEAQYLRGQRIESLGALAGGVAHDLNNVLTPIVVGVEMLDAMAKTPEDRATLQMVGDAARRGADIVRQLLLFGRGSDAPKEEMSLYDVVNDVSRILRETFPRQLKIKVVAPAELWRIRGDPTQLHQVLINLCVNARDAMPQGGTLSVAAENLHVDAAFAQHHHGARPGPHVVLRVTDTGCGIPAENLARVFDPFFTTKPVGHGTGLGLPTVLGIVKGHGGFVELQSQPGFGTEFSAFLPAVPTAASAQTPAVNPEGLGGHEELVLVVDDEPAVRHLVQKVLEFHHYRVLGAADGAEGLALFAKHADEIGAIVSDLMMPVMDGLKMIREIRRRSPAVPVIALSGLHGHGAELQKEGYQRVRLLSKPFAIDRLLALVRDMILEARESRNKPPA